jgi:putative endonuclease
LFLRSGALYVGACRDSNRRYADHVKGRASRRTSLDPPISTAYAEKSPSFIAARRREAQLRRWSRAKKEVLIRGDLQALKALAMRHAP